MRSLVEKFIPQSKQPSGTPNGIMLIPKALQCGTVDMLRAICEALAEEKLENNWEQRKYDNWCHNFIYLINNVQKTWH